MIELLNLQKIVSTSTLEVTVVVILVNSSFDEMFAAKEQLLTLFCYLRYTVENASEPDVSCLDALSIYPTEKPTEMPTSRNSSSGLSLVNVVIPTYPMHCDGCYPSSSATDLQ
jgi:hypothetical protein